MNKKIIISVAVIIVVIAASIVWLGNSAPRYTGPLEKVTIGSYGGEYVSLVYVAAEKGYFKDEGIDVEIKPYEYGILTIPDVLNGTLDMSLANEFAFVVRSFDFPKLRILASIDKTKSYELIARRDRGITTPADLKGKKIAIPKGSQSEFFLGTFLTFNHLSLRDVQVVYTQPFDLENAIASGKVDAILIWPPLSFNAAKKLGANAIVWDAQNGQNAYFVLIGSEDLVYTRPHVIEKTVRALMRAEEFVKNNTPEANQIVRDRTNTDERYIQYVWQQNSFMVSLDQTLLLSMEDEARWAIDNILIDKPAVPNYLDFISFDALTKVKPDAVTIVH